jgi:hypothetical protein
MQVAFGTADESKIRQCDNLSTLASVESCGKMQVLQQLLRKWCHDLKEGRNKVPSASYSIGCRMVCVVTHRLDELFSLSLWSCRFLCSATRCAC